MTSLFISYSRKDIESARKLTSSFKESNLDYWIDWEGIPPTVDWWREIENGIEQADVFLFLISPDSARSRVCKQEIDHAVKNGKRLIPIVVQDIKGVDVSPELSALNWIFLREIDDYDTAFIKLITAIQTDYDWVQKHGQLQNKALEWERNNRENGFLLHERELQDAEMQLAINSTKEPHPTSLQREYVLVSRQTTDRQRRNTTRTAILVSIALAALAVFGFIKARQATANSVLAQQQSSTAQAASVLASNNAGTAVANEQEAIRQSKIALARQLEAQAVNQTGARMDLAALLSLEAYRIDHSSDEAKGVLFKVIESNTRLLAYFYEHKETVESVAFSDGGKIFISADMDGYVILRDVKTGKMIVKLDTGQRGLMALALTQNAQFLAIGNDTGIVQVWDITSQKPLLSLQYAVQPVTSLAFSLDGILLASAYNSEGNQSKSIIVWDIQTGKSLTQPLVGHTSLIGSLAFSPDDRILVSGDDGSNIRVWDLSTAQPLGGRLSNHTSWISALVFSPDGRYFASGSGDHTIMLWDAQTLQPVTQLFGHTSWVLSLAFSPNGRLLASGGQDDQILIWDTKTFQQIGTPLSGHFAAVRSLAFSPDNLNLVSGGGDQVVILWDLEATTRLGKILSNHSTTIRSVAFSPDGKLLASASNRDGTIQVFNLDTNTSIQLQGHEGRIRQLTFSPNGKILASAGDDGRIILWDIVSGTQLVQLPGTKDAVLTLAFRPDGQQLATGGRDSKIYLWDVQTYQPSIPPFDVHFGAVRSIMFSPDGTMLASAGEDRRIFLSDLRTGKSTELYRDGLDLIYSVVFSPDGKFLASSGYPGEIDLWKVAEPESSPSLLLGHRDDVNSMAFDPHGNFLASGSNDGRIILWNWNSRQKFGELFAGAAGVNSVAFDPSGMRLASGSCDKEDGLLCGEGKVIVWDLDPDSWVRLACQVAGRNLTYSEWKEYFQTEEYHVTCPQWPVISDSTLTSDTKP